MKKEEDKARMERLQNWLDWTLGNLHRVSNSTTFLYIFWTPMVIFWSVIISMALPSSVACPKSNSICHHARALGLSAKNAVLWLPSSLQGKR